MDFSSILSRLGYVCSGQSCLSSIILWIKDKISSVQHNYRLKTHNKRNLSHWHKTCWIYAVSSLNCFVCYKWNAISWNVGNVFFFYTFLNWSNELSILQHFQKKCSNQFVRTTHNCVCMVISMSFICTVYIRSTGKRINKLHAI